MSRDELVECAALLDCVRRGELDRLVMPPAPLDILAQQIVAAAADEEWAEDDLFALVRRARPYRELPRAELRRRRRDARPGLRHPPRPARRLPPPRRGQRPHPRPARRAAHRADLRRRHPRHRRLPGGAGAGGDGDRLGERGLRRREPARRRLPARQRLVAHPQDRAQPGAGGGRARRAAEHPVLVRRGAEPQRRAVGGGEPAAAGGRSGGSGEDGPGRRRSVRWLVDEVGVAAAAAVQLVDYLAAARAALGVLPSDRTLVAERFFDEAGDMHLVLHSPFGSRLNRAWGLALRKRFCRTFNFELQAAATEDAIVLSLGPTHSFPLETVFSFLSSASVRDVLVQALLDAPMFGVRWRWNASRALALPRMRGGRRVPPQLQRHQAEDLLAVVFPDQLACLENIEGDREVPDHPLVEETLRDCLTDAMDVDALEAMLAAREAGGLEVVARDLTEPSPLAHEILTASPWAFLDDAPLEERRTQAVVARRWLDPETAADLGRLDAAAIERVRDEARPEANDADELHDALVTGGYVPAAAGEAAGWEGWLEELAAAGRAAVMTVRAAGTRTGTRASRCACGWRRSGGRSWRWRTGSTDARGRGGTLAPVIRIPWDPGRGGTLALRRGGRSWSSLANRMAWDPGRGGTLAPGAAALSRTPTRGRGCASAAANPPADSDGSCTSPLQSTPGARVPPHPYRTALAPEQETGGDCGGVRVCELEGEGEGEWVVPVFVPDVVAPGRLAGRGWSGGEAVREVVRARMEVLGPVTAAALAAESRLAVGAIEIASRRARGGGVGAPGAVHARRAGRRRGRVVRTAPARANPSLHPRPPAPRDRAGRPRRPGALPPRLAARGTGGAGGGAAGAGGGARAARRLLRRRPPPGKARSCRRGWRTTTRRGSTPSASPAASSGAARRRPPAAAPRPSRPLRSPSCRVPTSPTGGRWWGWEPRAAVGAGARAGHHLSTSPPRRSRSPRCWRGAAPPSSPISPPPPACSIPRRSAPWRSWSPAAWSPRTASPACAPCSCRRTAGRRRPAPGGAA